MNNVKLRLTGRQHSALFNHLFPGDGKEAIALALCGISRNSCSVRFDMIVMVHELFPIPYEKCSVREEDRLTWSTEDVADILIVAERKGLVVLKIHSHPTGYSDFSVTDDKADNELFPRISEWLDTDFPGISAVMLPDGKVFARSYHRDYGIYPVNSVLVAGPDIKFWKHPLLDEDSKDEEYAVRTRQAFGKGTTRLLSQLTIGIVGISGTGSPVVEQLYRLGAGSLILVDNDIVKELNVGRIYNSTINDAIQKRKKVDVIADSISESGLPTKVDVHRTSLLNEKVLRSLTNCDILFGCMDSIEGRDILNKLSVFYSIPYFDLGVMIVADGIGGVCSVSGAVHYLQPDGSSLFSRGVYSAKGLHAEAMKRTNPDQYDQQVDEGYIKGVKEDRPAVISLNTLIAGFAVNDFLARIHQIRLDSNEDMDCIRISLTNSHIAFEKAELKNCQFLSKYAGRGDMLPFLNTILIEEEG